jgi:DNA-binding transcriptional regulator YiaG
MSLFSDLKEALEDIRDYRAGKRNDLRVTRFSPPQNIPPKEIVKIRKNLRISKRDFALLLNISLGAIRSWEQGSRRPQNTALLVLTMAKKNPAVLLDRG